MNKLEIDPNNIKSAETKIPRGLPVTMINLVVFNETAIYENPGESACSGAEAYYKRYAPAFYEVAKELGIEGIEVVYSGNVAETILGPAEPKWDSIALVRYPTFAIMRRLLEDPLYLQRAEPHRIAALKSWEWIAAYQPSAS